MKLSLRRVVTEFQLGEERQSRPRKQWYDGIKQDLRTLDEENWRETIRNREKRMTMMVEEKTLEVIESKRKKKGH